MDDRGLDAFRSLLQDGNKGHGPKTEALEALSLRPVWLATWEPRAEGFRTLINASGEEALAVFSSEAELQSAAKQFEWLEADGTIATHRAIGGDILRHAWTREYAFLVVDIGSEHALEYGREELKSILRELDSTGPFRTSRPPAPSQMEKLEPGSFAPPLDAPVDRISTLYSMAPSQSEKLDRLSDIPTKPHDVAYDTEPPTQPRAALSESQSRGRKSSPRTHTSKGAPAAAKVEELASSQAEPGEGGTYGAASVIPTSQSKRSPTPPPEAQAGTSSRAPKLNSEAPTAPSAQPLPTLEPGKLKLPAVGPIAAGGIEPEPPSQEAVPASAKTEAPPTEAPPTRASPRFGSPSIGDGIKMVELYDPPDELLLETLGDVLRKYFEVEWASYCHVARPGGSTSPAIGLRVADDYRDNVTAIIKELCEASRKHHVEIDVLLIDGHDLLRKAREKAFVFYPWKPKA